jgi:hypothetical protein
MDKRVYIRRDQHSEDEQTFLETVLRNHGLTVMIGKSAVPLNVYSIFLRNGELSVLYFVSDKWAELVYVHPERIVLGSRWGICGQLPTSPDDVLIPFEEFLLHTGPYVPEPEMSRDKELPVD